MMWSSELKQGLKSQPARSYHHPIVRKSKTVFHSRLHPVKFGFQILYSGFQSPGIWIPQGKNSKIPDSAIKHFLDSRICIPLHKAMTSILKNQRTWFIIQFSGADPGFFLGGGALVSHSTSTPINHIVFFLQNTSCIRKLQVISGGGGCTPPAPSL